MFQRTSCKAADLRSTLGNGHSADLDSVGPSRACVSAFLTSSRRGTGRGRAHLETEPNDLSSTGARGHREPSPTPPAPLHLPGGGGPHSFWGDGVVNRCYVSDLGNSQELFC